MGLYLGENKIAGGFNTAILNKDKSFEKLTTINVAMDEDGTLPDTIIMSAEDNIGNLIEFTDFYIKCRFNITDVSQTFRIYANTQIPIAGNFKIGGISQNPGVLRNWYCAYKSSGEDNGGIFFMPNTTINASGSYPNINVSDGQTVFIPPKTTETTYKFNTFKNIVIQAVGTTFIEGSTFELWGVKK